MKWLAILIALIYFLLPHDLIPDFALGWGWLDDALIIYLLWKWIQRVQYRMPPRGGPHSGSSHRQGGATGSVPPDDSASQDPYVVLGLRPGASPDEIRQAYRKLALQYHPDKVAHLGEEFQALAEKRFKAIQEAYTYLSGK